MANFIQKGRIKMPDIPQNTSDIFSKTVSEFPLLKKYGVVGKLSPENGSAPCLMIWWTISNRHLLLKK